MAVTGEVLLPSEELEVLRLRDFDHLDQEKAADLMGVSRHTYGRILADARSIVAEALVTGKAMRIQGGIYEFRGGFGCGRGCRPAAVGPTGAVDSAAKLAALRDEADYLKESLDDVKRRIDGLEQKPIDES